MGRVRAWEILHVATGTRPVCTVRTTSCFIACSVFIVACAPRIPAWWQFQSSYACIYEQQEIRRSIARHGQLHTTCTDVSQIIFRCSRKFGYTQTLYYKWVWVVFDRTLASVLGIRSWMCGAYRFRIRGWYPWDEIWTCITCFTTTAALILHETDYKQSYSRCSFGQHDGDARHRRLCPYLRCARRRIRQPYDQCAVFNLM